MHFRTNIGLITTDGPYGPDVMACEWTHQVSYRPALISIHVNVKNATHENILASKVFGVNIASADQSVLSSVAGGNSGKTTDKIKALGELGFHFIQATQIPVLLVEGAAFVAECKLFDYRTVGDHTQFIGEVVAVTLQKEKEPLIYGAGKYWHQGENIPKPSVEEMERIKKIVATHKK
ncbi:flavin reductase [Candidatus Uhrbacteria bacterium]|nr:flavin reductase [Candidatus Uhrbacteria bacterium]